MSTARLCPVCHASLPGDAPKGMCPQCLSALAAGSPGAVGSTREDGRDPLSTNHPRAVRHFADFEIEGEIASGGMGVVFLARQISLNRPVALKMIRSGQPATPDEVRRFRTETEAAANLDHPNIVPIYEVGEHEGQHYFSMKLVEGGNLAERIHKSECRDPKGKRIPPSEGAPRRNLADLARVIAKVARAAHHAHQRGILHRDIKPTNILLDDQGEPHLADFGLAKLLHCGQDLTQTLAVLGTPHYMAPEQAAGGGRQITTAADIYSLGAILFESLTGRPPFTGESAIEILRQAQETEPPSVRQLNPEVGRDLETICLKCLEKDPSRRYDSAEDLAEDLDSWLAGEPIRARPAGRTERMLKWARRNPTVATLIALAHFLFFGGIAGVLWQWHRAEEEAIRAESSARQSDEQVVRMSVANGTRLLNLGDDLGALLWYAEALRLDAGDPTTERDHRVRLGTILRKVPILLQAWSRDGLANAIFSSDGNYVAVLGDQGRVAVFDADTFESIGPAVQHRVDTKYAHILFTPDSRRLISVGASLICVWEVGSGSLLGEYAHPSVSAAAVSPDGTLLATSSTDGTSKFWELDSDRMILSVQDEPSQRRYVQFSRDGRVLTAGLREILIRDPISGKTDFERHFDQDVNGAVFSLDGTLLASAHDDHARVWDARVGDPITKRLPHQAPVSVLEFSPDGRTLVSACADFAVRLWSIPAGVLLTDDPRHDNFIMDAAFGPDGRLLVTSGTDGTARVWDLETMQRIGPPLRHAGYVRLALWHPDGRRILTAGHDGQTRIWDLGSDRRHVRPWAGHATTPLLASRDGRWLVSQNSRYEVEVWDTERWQRRGPPVRHGNPVAFSAISDGGERLLTVGVHDPDGSEWRVWEIHSASLVSRAVAQVPARLKFRVDGDFRTAAAIRADGSGLMVRPATGELSGLKHEGPIARIALSPDGNRIAASCEDWRIHVWDARGLQERYPAIQASGPPNYLEFSRNSRWLAVACGDKYLAEREAQVWEVATGMPAGPPIRHARSLSFATFNGESDRLLTGGDDLTARVWDFHSGVAISPRLVTIGHVIAGAFARDSRWVATGRSGAVYLWSARLGQPLTPQMPLLRQTDTLRFVDSDRALLTGTGVGAQLWNLAPDERPMEDLVRLAQLLSGHSIDNTGVFEPLPVAALRERWVSLQRNYPEEFEWVPDGANLIPLFAESTLRWNFKRRSPDASIAFDVINREDGLVERFNTDGVTEPVTVDGVACRRAVRQAGKGNFLYLAIAPVRKSERPVDVMVEVEYFDGVDGRFYVQYDAAPNEGGEGQAYARSMESRRLQSSRQWRSAWFRLPRARFANSQNVQADFRLAIEAPELCVRRVTVAGLPRFDGTSPIPARLPQTSARLLDLSNFYTTGFLGNWHGDQTDNDLSELPTGVQTFGGVEFDVRGLIQLRGANSGSRAFPDKVTGLPIGRRCARLHFLHSAIWGTVADGTLIGHYMILYADGGTDSIPIVLGGNVRDWWSHPNEPPLPGTMKIAWRGANGKSRIENAEIRLFQTSWANPRPDQVIQSIDFVSAQAAAAPFLIAISLEP